MYQEQFDSVMLPKYEALNEVYRYINIKLLAFFSKFKKNVWLRSIEILVYNRIIVRYLNYLDLVRFQLES